MRNGRRQHPVLAFHGQQAVDKAAHRLAAGMHDGNHLAVVDGAGGLDLSFRLGHAQVHQVVGAVQDVGMRVFLEAHQEVGGRGHRRRQVAVRVQLGADDRAGADDLARAPQQVALAVVITVSHHCTMQAEQGDIHGAGAAQVFQQFVAQGFVGVAGGHTGRHGAGHHAFDQRPVFACCALPRRPQGPGKHLHAVGMLPGRKVTARAVSLQARRNGRKRIRLGCQGS